MVKKRDRDDDSNPQPSFIDQHINDIFFYRNRLGVIAGENVILTRSADFFNFWMTSALEVQDTDPIDLAVSDNKIATLLHAVPYDETLVLFSDDAQFILRCDGVLNPKDANIPPPVTRFGNSVKAKPACAGRNLYFPAERSEYTTVREFFTAADNTDRKDAQDITSHIPNYIPNGVYKLIPSTVENLILFLTEGAENKVYIYKYLLWTQFVSKPHGLYGTFRIKYMERNLLTLTSTLLLSVMEYYVSKKCPLVSTRQTLKTNLIGSFRQKTGL